MKYIYKCPECSTQSVCEMTTVEYTELNGHGLLCIHIGGNHNYTVEMERVYSPVKVQFKGKGFTGAGGAIPQMEKKERVKDLAEKTNVEGI